MFPSNCSARARSHVALSVLLLLAACGGDDSSHDSKQPPIGQDSPKPTPAPPDPPPPPPPPEPTPSPTPPPTPAPTPGPPEVVLDTSFTPLTSGTANSQPYWPDGSGTGVPIDGVGCASSEDYHIHALLSIYKDGIRLAVPKEIGLKGCTYELHTHDYVGTIHIETNMPKNFTLGQFFSLWGRDLTRSSVAGLPGPVRYYLIEDGRLTPFAGDPRTIQLLPHREILVLSGKSPGIVPKYQW